MRIEDVRSNLLVATPAGEVLKVSEVRRGSEVTLVSAQVLLPLPPRTTVRRYLPEAVLTWAEPTDEQVAAYEAAWGLTPSTP